MDRWLMYMKKAALLHEQRSLLKTVTLVVSWKIRLLIVRFVKSYFTPLKVNSATLKVYFTTPDADPYFFSGLIIETVIWFFCFRSSLANFWISFAVIPLTICS